MQASSGGMSARAGALSARVPKIEKTATYLEKLMFTSPDSALAGPRRIRERKAQLEARKILSRIGREPANTRGCVAQIPTLT
jgi:hypothetical protein